MKKLLALIAAFLFVGITLVSCDKDESESASNSITIVGSILVGDKTYENPTFDLGNSDDNIGWFQTNYKKSDSIIVIGAVSEIDLGDNIALYYDYTIYGDTPGDFQSFAHIAIYLNESKSSFSIFCDNLTTTLTKVGDVGGYIEGFYEGSFQPEAKTSESYAVKGNFRVKRVKYLGPQ